MILAVAGCAGSRAVARPNSVDGYRKVELRDVGALGMQDENIELTGTLGPMTPQEVCGGLITFMLINGTTLDSNPFGGQVTLSIPRERWDAVRDFKPLERVRVRGYISKWFADGCTWFSRTAGRFLWIDTIERVAAN